MSEYPYVIYSAFSDTRFGGSKAALVDNANTLDENQMQDIAKDFGLPATGFITGVSDNQVNIRFFSTQTEYPMCGHASIALATWLVDHRKWFDHNNGTESIKLMTPESSAMIQISKDRANKTLAMLKLDHADCEMFGADKIALTEIMGLTSEQLNSEFPIALTRSDFVHLIVPMNNLAAMSAINADFDAIADYCRKYGIDTMMLFTTETNLAQHTVHCREFAPAVGTPETAATGTTNRALACYLFDHAVVKSPANGCINIIAEQGVEMGRPSLIHTELQVQAGEISSIRVGGNATLLMAGLLYYD